MKKNDFVKLLKEVGNYDTEKDAEKALNSVLNAIVKGTIENKEVAFVGFGTFSLALQKGREGKVPGKPDQTYKTKDKYVPKFKAGKTFKDFAENIPVK